MNLITFRLVDSSAETSEVKQLLNDVHCAVIVQDGLYYAIEQHEKNVLPDGEEIGAWLLKVQWLPSSAIEKEQEADWRRPVVFIENEIVQRVMTPSFHNRLMTAYFETLAETISDSVTAVDEHGTVLFWNTPAEETYGISKEVIVGHPIGSYFQAESLMLNSVLQQGRLIRGEYHRPNENTHVLINASPVELDGFIFGGIATEHNITNVMKLNEELDSALPPYVQIRKPFASITGSDPKLLESLEAARKAAHADMPVYLTGEPGSGKEMIARAIHYSGSKATGPFAAINCSTIPEALLEIELFGYKNQQPGKIEQAKNGTLFIENIDHLPELTREKLIAYSGKTRLIFASTAPVLLGQAVSMMIAIPPLRERKGDILLLATTFIEEFSSKYGKQVESIHPDAAALLELYDWPGNVRELRSVIERCVLLGSGPVITSEHFPEVMVHPVQTNDAQAIQQALEKTYGNKSAAAALLGISRGTLYNKMREYGL